MYTLQILLIISIQWIFSQSRIQCPYCNVQSCSTKQCHACAYHNGDISHVECKDDCQHSDNKCCTDENCIATVFGSHYSQTFVNCPICNGDHCHTVKCIECKINTRNCRAQNTCFIEPTKCHADTHEKCCRDDHCIHDGLLKCHSTTIVTTTTPVSTTRTTTTIPKTTSTSTLRTTAFTPQQPTTHSVQRSCKVCGNYENESPCDTRSIYFGPTSACEGGKSFCMTDLVHDQFGNDKIYKRCVDESVCKNLWISHSSTQNRCVNFGSVLATGNYSCHFCCTSDDCNMGLLPDPTTFYTVH